MRGLEALGLCLLLSLASSRHGVSGAATPETEARGAAAAETAERLQLPPLKRLASHSFRGPIGKEGRIPGWDLSGYASRVVSSDDYLRLVPPNALSHGAVFSAPLSTSSGWVVELGFRMHGRGETGSGGRGLALWYTKTSNPSAITLASDPRKAPTPPPADVLSTKGGDDASTSFFGGRSAFDGLGIVFDAAATKPLLARSQYRAEDAAPALVTAGADAVGVVAALVDDGSGGGRKGSGFLNLPTDEAKPEARYLDNSQDECEAGFRNAPGLVWARVSYIEQRIRVDLDLTPHTTLSTAERNFTHHCLTVNNVKLPSGFHFGISALASSNGEPDAVDVYAFDAYEVVAESEGDEYARAAAADARLGDTQRTLAGTSVGDGLDGVGSEARKFFVALMQDQTRMFGLLDSLSQRVDELAGQYTPTGLVGRRLSAIEGRVGGLDTSQLGSGLVPGDGPTLREVLSAVEKLDTELANLRGRIDTMSNGVQGSLQTVRTRVGELFNSWQTAVETEFERTRIAREAAAKSRLPSTPVLFLLLACLLIFIVLRAVGDSQARRRADENELGVSTRTSGITDYFSGGRRRPKKNF